MERNSLYEGGESVARQRMSEGKRNTQPRNELIQTIRFVNKSERFFGVLIPSSSFFSSASSLIILFSLHLKDYNQQACISLSLSFPIDLD